MRNARRVAPAVLFVAAALLFFFGSSLLGFYVDWLWYGEVGGRGVLWGVLGAKALLGLVFGAGLTGLTYLNLVLARKLTPRYLPRAGEPEWRQRMKTVAREGLALLLLAGSAVLGALGGLLATSRWDDWLRFVHGQAVGTVDPVFHRDLGFYLFQYPFLRFAADWLLAMLVLVAAATAMVYYMEGALGFARQRFRIPDAAQAHLSVLLGLALLAKAWDYWLDRFGLLLQPSGILYGAGYTDLHARLAALNILAVVAVIAALGFFMNTRVRALWLPGLAVALMVVASFTVGGLYPSLVQRLVVAPNEGVRERAYIDYHIRATRQAYGLDRMQARDYNPSQQLAAADLAAEKPTLENVRLWDYRVLGQAFQRIQQIWNYYDVSDVDVDRYHLDGAYRQVMLAPRELVADRLEPQQRRWVNERLKYTHGYGLVMSRVNETDPSGRPAWLVSNLPLETAPGIRITRPQLYFGMAPYEPVVAPSGTPELDYPTQNESVTSRYEARGGIPVDSVWMRALFSTLLGDGNLFISDQVRKPSKILIRRNVAERVQRLAPFLQFDHDPYLVVQDGRLVWLQDAYTTASTYPYSEPTDLTTSAVLGAAGDVNYIRNSVKATVDAYTGAVTLYAMDSADPVLRAYEGAFPGLFKPAAELPPSLREHIRYPEDLFFLQARKMGRFHVTNPDVFYSRSDVWDIPAERLHEREAGGQVIMEPYYVIMRLPGETEEEFALIMPFKTRNGSTMSAWMAARCDGENYGQLRLYRFPTNAQVDAPEQVDNTIFADSDVSKTTTLLGQRGSRIRYGNLLILPVGKSLLYVKPLYVEATQGAGADSAGGIPELKYVILAERRGGGTRVVMRPTLREALAALVGAETEEAPPGPSAPSTPSTPPTPTAAGVPALVREAASASDAAERAQRAGDWAEYGRQQARLRAALKRLERTVGTPPAPPKAGGLGGKR